MKDSHIFAISFAGASIGTALTYLWLNRSTKIDIRKTSRGCTPSKEKTNMLNGDLYLAGDEQLTNDRTYAHDCCHLINQHSAVKDTNYRQKIFKALLGEYSTTYPPYIEAPFYCDYGYNITIGERFYANFGCVFLDCAAITIGNDVFLAPNVQLYTAGHPLDPSVRNMTPSGKELEFAKPITIGNSCWIGGGVIILPGVTIGDNVVIAAGSVVSKDVPPNSVAAGVPARVIKELNF